MSLPDDMHSHYGFNFSTLMCNSLNLDLIKGVFGREDDAIGNVEPEKTEITWPTEQKDVPRTEVSETVKEEEFQDSIHRQNSSKETDTETETDTESETTVTEQCQQYHHYQNYQHYQYASRSVVCVDCSCCLPFCECGKASSTLAPARAICNPVTCRHVVCSDCTLCTDHCTCRCEV